MSRDRKTPTLLDQRLAEAGTTVTRLPDGRVAVDRLPGPRVSNPNFLTDEFKRYERERAGKREGEG